MNKKPLFECIHDKQNSVSRIFCWWVTKFFTANYGKSFDISDLYKCSEEEYSAKLGSNLESNWQNELHRKKHGKSFSLLRAILQAIGMKYFHLLFCNIIILCFVRPALPITLGLLVRYLDKYRFESEQSVEAKENSRIFSTNIMNIYCFSALFCTLLSINTILCHPYFLSTFRTAIRIRIGTSQLIYKKALKLSNSAIRSITFGQIVNLISNDVDRFETALIYAHYLIVGPIQMVIMIVLLWHQIGISCLAGITILILYMPLQAFMGHSFSKYRARTSILTDERIRLMSEIIPAIRVIKMYVWEIPFGKLVELTRIKEVQAIKKSMVLRSINLAIFSASSPLIIFLCLVLFVIGGGSLNAENVYVTIALINQLRDVMTLSFSSAVSSIAEALISLRRIQKFLLLEENEQNNSSITSKTGLNKVFNTENDMNCEISLRNVCVNQISSDGNEINILSDISFHVRPGKLTVIIGSVGSGKTSVLMSIIKELPIVSGEIKVKGKIAYASQESWIFGGTVRENILFGSVFDEAKYEQVIHVTALEEDIKQLPFGDNTVVGERGITLSGGQRARVNLARALYSNADCYLLDDPLSAVDSVVAKHIFEKCIKGYLWENCVVLVTNQLQFIKEAHQIIVLKDGKCLAHGSYNQLLTKGVDLIEYAGNPESSEEPGAHPELKTKRSLMGEMPDLINNTGEKLSVNNKIANNQIKESEASEKSSFKLIWIYLRSGAGLILLPILLISTIIKQLLFTGSDYWISQWTNYYENVHIRAIDQNYTFIKSSLIDTNQNNNIIIYSLIIVVLFVFSLLRTFFFFEVCMRASVNLHNRLFASVTRAPISFFDSKPIGILLNRFSRDLTVIDDLLPPTAYYSIEILLNCMMIAILCIYIDYWISIPSLTLLLIFLLIQRYFNETAKRLKKVVEITRSPIFSHLSNSLYGLTTIRSSGFQSEFVRKFDSLQDTHTSAYFMFACSTQWLAVVLDFLCVLFVIAITVSSILNINVRTGSEIGLSITQALLLSNSFRRGIRQSAEFETQLTSVERVVEFSHLEKESQSDVKPPEDWPTKGQIAFKDVSLQYNSSDPPVLNNLDLVINGGEKIGIVGRTGAGKSSIIATLFRMTQPTGLITIDGIDTSSISLSELRKNISIIPQEPILFSGTVRRNLDPFGERSDDILWKVLEKVQLKATVNSFPLKLDQLISESGANFSVGQKQLICLARAMLRNNKILVLDEATANVDPKTDSLIQQKIRTEFNGRTVLTIAHRLNTVMDYDKILVLDAGRIKQYDFPYSLIQQKDGIFAEMLETTGHSMKNHLTEIARQSYYRILDTIVD